MWEIEKQNEEQAKTSTEMVKGLLNDFLVTQGHTLETFGDFIKELDDRQAIIQIKLTKGSCDFTIVELEERETNNLLESFNQDIYFQAQCLEINALMACVDEGFQSSGEATGRFLFSKEAQVLYSYNRKDFDGDTMVLKKVKRPKRQGGEFVQETHFKKTNNKSKRW